MPVSFLLVLTFCEAGPPHNPTYWSLLIQPVRAAPGRGIEPHAIPTRPGYPLGGLAAVVERVFTLRVVAHHRCCQSILTWKIPDAFLDRPPTKVFDGDAEKPWAFVDNYHSLGIED